MFFPAKIIFHRVRKNQLIQEVLAFICDKHYIAKLYCFVVYIKGFFLDRLPYREYVGGAIVISKDAMIEIKGFSNVLFGSNKYNDDMHFR